MILKERTESDELLTMRYLDTRMELTNDEKFHYSNLEKGYEGELKFDLLVKNLEEERYIINDLLLEVNKSYFQIDSLLISQGVIHLLDIKNFQGDFYLDSDKLYSMTTNREWKNPVDQLKRSTTLLRQLLQKLKLNYLIESWVIFINPEFTLYQAPKNQPIIYPTQVNRFIKDLTKTSSKLNDGHKNLAQTLMSLHQPKNPFTQLPEYNYEQLHKGIYCNKCKSYMIVVKNKSFDCKECGESEKLEVAILRNVEEFKILFPDRKITTQNILEWCKVDLHARTISRVLKKNYTVYGITSNTYYR